MAFPMGSQVPQTSTVKQLLWLSFTQLKRTLHCCLQSELCLRFPENVGIHTQISDEQAIGLLNQAAEMAPRVPFAWSYIDKPPGMLRSF